LIKVNAPAPAGAFRFKLRDLHGVAIGTTHGG
jgi:hypothetical protein